MFTTATGDLLRVTLAAGLWTTVLSTLTGVPLALWITRLRRGGRIVRLLVLLPLAMLPSIKGGIVGLQWANYMHGFDPRSDGREDWDGLDPERFAPAKLET